MPNSSGRIYTNSSYGVSIGDLQTVFNTNINDVGGIINYGVARDLINIWAKYKPVRSSKTTALTDAERKDVNYGLKATKYTNLATLVSNFSGEYEYQWPRGGSVQPKEWYRILDFNGYNQNATCPVASFQGVSGDVQEGTNLQVCLNLNPQNQSPAGSLQWSDLCPDSGSKNMDDYYFGVIIRTGTTSTYRLITMSEVIGNGNSMQERWLYLPATYFSDGAGTSYTLYPVLTYNPVTTIQTGGSYPTGVYVVPNATPTTFTLRTAATVVSYSITDMDAWVTAGKYKVSIEGAVKASQSRSGTIYYRIYEGTDTTGTVVATGEFWPYGAIPTTTTYVTLPPVTINRAVPQYVTAVLVYQDLASLPMTVEVSTTPPDLDPDD